MSDLAIERSAEFDADVFIQYCWYRDRANEELAWQYSEAVDATLDELARHPEMGRLRAFRSPSLRAIRSFRVNDPFQRHLIFYRGAAELLTAVRILPGERDLEMRLLQPPGAE